jgi:hypothetical protein
MAITNMPGSRWYEHALGRSGFAADYEIVPTEIEALESQRHERQQRPVMPARGVQERCAYCPGFDEIGDALGIVEQGKQVRFGQHAAQRFDHLFAASHSEKPIVHYGYAHHREV